LQAYRPVPRDDRRKHSVRATSATAGEIADAAQLGNAHEFIKLMPNGYQTMVGERG
jgi:ABC-type multidrug transport system fused ATPase/permease subunit